MEVQIKRVNVNPMRFRFIGVIVLVPLMWIAWGILHIFNCKITYHN